LDEDNTGYLALIKANIYDERPSNKTPAEQQFGFMWEFKVLQGDFDKKKENLFLEIVEEQPQWSKDKDGPVDTWFEKHTEKMKMLSSPIRSSYEASLSPQANGTMRTVFDIYISNFLILFNRLVCTQCAMERKG